MFVKKAVLYFIVDFDRKRPPQRKSTISFNTAFLKKVPGAGFYY